MRFTICFALALVGCVTSSSSTTSELKNCALMGDSAEVVCHGTDCAWRGESCTIDECGVAPAYPGYAASPSEDGQWTTIQTSQWNKLRAYMDGMQAFQACEVSRP